MLKLSKRVSAAVEFASMARRSFRWRVWTAFMAMDFAFMLLVLPAFAQLLSGYVPSASPLLSGVTLRLVTGITGVWLSATFLLLTPLERWLRAEAAGGAVAPELVGQADARARSLPRWLGGLWSLKWIVLYSLLSLAHGVPGTTPSVLFFLGALAVGPLPLAYLLALWFVWPLSTRIAAAASVTAAPRPAATSMRWQLALLSSCLCFAPSLYVTSVVFAEHLSESTRTWMVLLFFGPIALFAVMCAALFAQTVVRPVRLIDATVRAIAEEGDVSRVGRILPLRRDEIGQLAQRINVMVDRLEATERDRLAATRAVEALNQTLERRVSERTLSLAQTNQMLALEMQTCLQLEIELRQAQKLESVGRLASGIAHEINTPLQFVGDNLQFISQSTQELLALVEVYRKVTGRLASTHAELAAELAEAEAQADLEFLSGEAPKALTQAAEGLSRVTMIVSSMKSFAHADQKEMRPCDLNQSIVATLVIARNEYNECADVVTDLRELPVVTCHAGSLNQALLNIIVNAAHAIADKGSAQRGLITIATRPIDGNRVEISIRDSGGGIPEAVRERVFDPFFTTKEVGRGTGQGLAICRSVIVDQHGGELDFETELGEGTTFFIRLPVGETGRPAVISHASQRAHA